MRLYMEPYTLFQALERLQRTVWDMEDMVLQMERISQRVKWGWEGDAALDFLERYSKWQRDMNLLLDDIHSLLSKTHQHVLAWEELDQRWAAFWNRGGYV